MMIKKSESVEWLQRSARQVRSVGLPLIAVGLASGCGGFTNLDPGTSPLSPIEPVVHPADEDLLRVEGFSEEIFYLLLGAELAGQREDLELALDNYWQVARETRDVGVIQRALRIAFYAENLPVAEEVADLWQEIEPDSMDARQALASLALQRRDYETAERHFRFIIEAAGTLQQKMQLILGALEQGDDTGMIFEILDRLVAESAREPEVLLHYANALIRFEQLVRAEEQLRRLLKQVPDHAGAAQALMSLLQQQGRLDEAQAWLDDNRDSFPLGSGLPLFRARLLVELELYSLARESLEELAEYQQDNAEILFPLGLVLMEQGLLEEARERFAQLARLDPYVNRASYHLGWIAEQTGEMDEALRWYRAVDEGPVYVQARARLAVLWAQQGELEQAREELERLLESFPEQAVSLVLTEAEMLIELDRHDEALKIYNAALEQQGYDTTLLYARAMLAEKMDRLDLLERDLRRILRREPDNAIVLNALGYTLADRTDRYDEAYGLIKQSLLLNPNNFYTLDSMGWVLYRLNRLQEAIEHLQRAGEIRADPEQASHLGEVLWFSGERQQARKVWEEGLERFPDNDKLREVIERFTR